MNAPKFEFQEPTVVMLKNVNPRKELHGEEHVQAVDLSFEVDLPNTMLDKLFSPGLHAALYYNASADSGQTDLDGVDATLPNLRFPKLNGQKYSFGGKDKLMGYTLRLEFGLGDSVSNIELELCKVIGRGFEAKEGGTVTVFWKVQNASNRLDMDTCGKLVLLGGEEVTMSLRAPLVQATEQEQETDPDDIGPGPLFPEHPEDDDAPKTAEDLFCGAAGGEAEGDGEEAGDTEAEAA